MKILKKRNEGRLKRLADTSVFFYLMKGLSDFFYNKICTSKTAEAFSSYDKLDSTLSHSLSSSFVKRFFSNKKKRLLIKNAIGSKIENSTFATLFKKLVSNLLGTKTRSYGIVLLAVALISILRGVLGYLSDLDLDANLTHMWQGAALAFMSTSLLSSKEQFCHTLTGSVVGNGILRFLGYTKHDVMRDSTPDNIAVPIIAGVLLGGFTVFLPPLYVVLGIVALLYLVIAFQKPEISMIVTVASLPFLPTMLICAEIGFTLFAYIVKLLRGKRSFKVTLLDLFVFIFALFLFFGGVFSVSPATSLPPACVFICFMVSYFLIVNLIKTKELVKKTLLSVIVAFSACSLYGIYQNFFAAPDTTWTDEDMFSEIETRVVSTFENPNVFGEYLIMLLPLAFAFFVIAKDFNKKATALIPVALGGMALIYTWSRGAWLGCIFAFIIMFIIVNKRAISLYFLGLFSLPLAIPIIPSSILDRFTSIGNMTDTSTSYRVFIWEASAKMIKDYFFGGIGIGTGAFQSVYSEYALAGIETAPHSHNLYLQVLLELGIFGFIIFIATMFFFFCKVFTFLKDSKSREMSLIVGAIACGLMAILVQGLTDYVWYNYRVFAFFWMMIGVASAAINISKPETKETEMM